MKNRLYNILECCYLCVKYPFLYPRNRFTDKHWNSRKLHNYLYGFREQWYNHYNVSTKKYEKIVIKEATPGIWDKAFENVYDDNGYLSTRTISRIWAIWFYIINFISNYILPIFHCIPTYTELDAMPDGWRKAFGLQMCKELKHQLKKEHYLYKYRIMQIKEKYGYLHWYDACSSTEVQKIITKYENISWNTCIVCGEPSTIISSGWICPYCDDCYKTHHPAQIPYQKKINGKWTDTKEYIQVIEEMDK